MTRHDFYLFAAAFCVSVPLTSEASVLKVGTGEPYEYPSQAANAAQPGDRIEITAGTYHDCAIWRTDSLEIIGFGEVILADNVCEDKAIFVVKGDDIQISGINFTGAKARTHNAAGIRSEGRNLTIENSRFINNENGILAGTIVGSTIIVRDSYFRGNGNCIQSCSHGIYIGRISELRIENSEFFEQHVGHHIKSRAARTILLDNFIHDGPNGTSSYLIDIPNGGTLVVRGNILEKGPKSENRSTAISISAEGTTNFPTDIVIENNTFSNLMSVRTSFIRVQRGTEVVMQENNFSGEVNLLLEVDYVADETNTKE